MATAATAPATAAATVAGTPRITAPTAAIATPSTISVSCSHEKPLRHITNALLTASTAPPTSEPMPANSCVVLPKTDAIALESRQPSPWHSRHTLASCSHSGSCATSLPRSATAPITRTAAMAAAAAAMLHSTVSTGVRLPKYSAKLILPESSSPSRPMLSRTRETTGSIASKRPLTRRSTASSAP